MPRRVYFLKVYRDRSVDRDWRWSLYATNGLLVACSGEGYRHRRHCRTMANKLFHAFDLRKLGR